MATPGADKSNHEKVEAQGKGGDGRVVSSGAPTASIESKPAATGSEVSNVIGHRNHNNSDVTIKTTPHEETAEKYKLVPRKSTTDNRTAESTFWQFYHFYESEKPDRHDPDAEYANCNYCGYDVEYKRPGQEKPSLKPIKSHIQFRHKQVAKLLKAKKTGKGRDPETQPSGDAGSAPTSQIDDESPNAPLAASQKQRQSNKAENGASDPSSGVAAPENGSATSAPVPNGSTRRDRAKARKARNNGNQRTVSTPPITNFEVFVSKDTFKFNAAHFVAYRGFRERLHGHNYRVSVRLLGSRSIGPDGYLMDFGNVKVVTKKICKDLNEHFLCPRLSDVIQITEHDHTSSIQLKCEDGATFVFPKSDCALLPIMHATTEELAIYLWGEILNGLNAEYMLQRGIHTMEVTVAEAIGQEATFRNEIGGTDVVAVSSYVKKGDIVPMPCLEPTPSKPPCCPSCDKEAALKRLAEAINKWELDPNNVTAADLERLLQNDS